MNDFDQRAAIEARDAAIDQVGTNAGDDWTKRAESVLRDVATLKRELTTDDLRIAGLDDPPNDPRAFGALMRNGALNLIIARTDRTINSNRVTSHRRPLRVWQSLIYRGA